MISQEQLLEATREELETTGLGDERLEKNLALAEEVFRELNPVTEIGVHTTQMQVTGSVASVPFLGRILPVS